MRSRSNGAERRYRSKLEVLGDFLGAVRQAPKKTRIVGLANLNPASFEKYLSFCLNLRLVETRPDGYHLTDRAVGALNALERIVSKSTEMDRAVDDLRHLLGNGAGVRDDGLTLHWISRLAWSEVLASTETAELTIRPEPRGSFADAPTVAKLGPRGDDRPHALSAPARSLTVHRDTPENRRPTVSGARRLPRRRRERR